MEKKPIARIPASLSHDFLAVAKKIENAPSVKLTPTLSYKSIPILDSSTKSAGALLITDLGTFTVLQINAISPLSGNELDKEVSSLKQVFGWYVRPLEGKVELLRVLQNPTTANTQGNQAWLALKAIGFNTTSLGDA